MFGIVRLIIGGVVWLVCIFLVNKSKCSRKRILYFIISIFIIVLTTLSAFIPAENVVSSFSSPEAAYKYTYAGDVKLIIEGKQTNFIVGGDYDTDIYAIVQKKGSEWGVCIASDTKRINQKVVDGIVIYVYQYKNTDEYYITIFDTSGGPSEIYDNYDSQFYYLSKSNDTLNKEFYTYYAYIYDIGEDYSIIVNGKEISLCE